MPLSEFSRFLSKHPGAGVIDAVVDTTRENGVVVPVLGIGLYRAGNGASLAEAARMAYDNEDDGFFYDELDLVDDCDDMLVATFYPRWPHDREAGDQALMHALCELVPKPAEGAPRKTYLFHHVDSQPYFNLLTGKPFATHG